MLPFALDAILMIKSNIYIRIADQLNISKMQHFRNNYYFVPQFQDEMKFGKGYTMAAYFNDS